MRAAHLSLLLLGALALGAFEAVAYDHSAYLKYYQVDAPVATARELLKKANITNTADRLAVMLLYSHDISNWEYGPCLKCSLQMIDSNLQGMTRADLFFFVKAQHFQGITSRPWVQAMRNLFMMTLDDSSHSDSAWRWPNWMRPPDKGWSAGFSEEYRLMGQWRLAFSFPFAMHLGYKYMLQMDTDTYIEQPVPYDLVAFMRDKGLYLTDRLQGPPGSREDRDYQLGLPELARFWIITRRAIQRYSPLVTADNVTAAAKFIAGPIFKHCNPPDFSGLRTQDTKFSTDFGWDGWDAQTIVGHFNVFSLDWWFSWEVQDFLQLVLRTGAHLEHRWIDIATQAMINHLFCPEDKFYMHKEFRVEHGRWKERREAACAVDWMA